MSDQILNNQFPHEELALRVDNYQAASLRGPVVDYQDPVALKAKLTDLHSKSDAGSWESIWEAVDFYLSHSVKTCLLYTSPSPRDLSTSRMPSSA